MVTGSKTNPLEHELDDRAGNTVSCVVWVCVAGCVWRVGMGVGGGV